MTLTALPRVSEDAGDGSTLEFAVAFQFFATSDLVVILRDADGVEDLQVLAVDYTVTGGSGSTGTVTFGTAPASGLTVSIAARTPIEHATAYPDGGRFPTSAIERDFDRLAAIDREQQDQIDDLQVRALVVPVGQTAPALGDLSAMADGDVLAMLNGVIVAIPNDTAAIAQDVLDAEASAVAAAASEAAADADAVQTAADRVAAAASEAAAENSKLAAEAFMAGALFATTAAGIAAVADGAPFLLQGASGGTVYASLYRRVGAAAVAQGLEIPSRAALNLLIDTTARAVASETVTVERRNRVNNSSVVRTVSAEVVYDVFPPGAGSDGDGYNAGLTSPNNFTTAQPRIIGSWIGDAVQPGLPTAGILKYFEIPPGYTLGGGGGSFQVWVLRPSAALGDTNGAISATLVAALGEFPVADAAAAARWTRCYPPQTVQVQAGDLLFVRGINIGQRFFTTGVAHDHMIVLNPVDQTMAALNAGFTAVAPSTARYPLRVVIDPFAKVMDRSNGPSLPLWLDRMGNVPPAIGRSVDMRWKGRTAVVVGTSIEYGAIGSAGTTIQSPDTNWVNQLFEALQCIGYNEGLSSSYITYKGTSESLSLSATGAELTTINGSGAYAAFSYETKIIAHAPDLLIMPHGFNDRDFTIGSITDTARTTFYGANNYVCGAYLDAVPHGRILFVTPTHEYGTQFLTDPTIVDAKIANVRAAVLALADKWGAPVADVTRRTGVNLKTIGPNSGAWPTGALPDKTHPAQWIQDNQAAIVYAVARAM